MKRKISGLLSLPLAAALLLSGCSMAKSDGEMAPGNADGIYPSCDIEEGTAGETYQEII